MTNRSTGTTNAHEVIANELERDFGAVTAAMKAEDITDALTEHGFVIVPTGLLAEKQRDYDGLLEEASAQLAMPCGECGHKPGIYGDPPESML